jgi:hypothetical protein
MRGAILLAALLPAPALAAVPPGAELACAYEALSPDQRHGLAIDYSAANRLGEARVAATLTPVLAGCSARYGWDDARRRWAGDYAAQRAELEARAAALPGAAPAERLREIFASLPPADRKGMGQGSGVSDAEFRAIGLRLRQRFDGAGIPRAAQAPAAGYLLSLAHLDEVEAAWAALPGR